MDKIDYTKIENPYDEFMNRAVEPSEINSSPNILDDNTDFENMRVSGEITSIGWQPSSSGFKLDGKNGNAEFQQIRVGRTIESIVGLIVDSDRAKTISTGASDYVFISPNKTSGYGSSEAIINASSETANKTTGIKIAIRANNGASNIVGIDLTPLTSNSLGTGQRIGISMDMPNVGNPAVLKVNGSEYANGAVGGSQDKKLRIYIGSTIYYIPCYTS